jgi:hypothetical protein
MPRTLMPIAVMSSFGNSEASKAFYMVVKKYIEISRTPLWSDGDDGVV